MNSGGRKMILYFEILSDFQILQFSSNTQTSASQNLIQASEIAVLHINKLRA